MCTVLLALFSGYPGELVEFGDDDKRSPESLFLKLSLLYVFIPDTEQNAATQLLLALGSVLFSAYIIQVQTACIAELETHPLLDVNTGNMVSSFQPPRAISGASFYISGLASLRKNLVLKRKFSTEKISSLVFPSLFGLMVAKWLQPFILASLSFSSTTRLQQFYLACVTILQKQAPFLPYSDYIIPANVDHSIPFDSLLTHISTILMQCPVHKMRNTSTSSSPCLKDPQDLGVDFRHPILESSFVDRLNSIKAGQVFDQMHHYSSYSEGAWSRAARVLTANLHMITTPGLMCTVLLALFSGYPGELVEFGDDDKRSPESLFLKLSLLYVFIPDTEQNAATQLLLALGSVLFSAYIIQVQTACIAELETHPLLDVNTGNMVSSFQPPRFISGASFYINGLKSLRRTLLLRAISVSEKNIGSRVYPSLAGLLVARWLYPSSSVTLGLSTDTLSKFYSLCATQLLEYSYSPSPIVRATVVKSLASLLRMHITAPLIEILVSLSRDVAHTVRDPALHLIQSLKLALPGAASSQISEIAQSPALVLLPLRSASPSPLFVQQQQQQQPKPIIVGNSASTNMTTSKKETVQPCSVPLVNTIRAQRQLPVAPMRELLRNKLSKDNGTYLKPANVVRRELENESVSSLNSPLDATPICFSQ